MNYLQAYLNSPRARKALSKKPGEEGFSLIELVVVVAVLAVLSAIAIPSFVSITDKARSAATVAKECAVKIAQDSTTTHTYAAVNLDGYDSFQVDGSSTNCSDEGTIVATSADTSKYPTFQYNIETGEKTCTASGDAVGLGCNSDGEW